MRTNALVPQTIITVDSNSTLKVIHVECEPSIADQETTNLLSTEKMNF